MAKNKGCLVVIVDNNPRFVEHCRLFLAEELGLASSPPSPSPPFGEPIRCRNGRLVLLPIEASPGNFSPDPLDFREKPGKKSAPGFPVHLRSSITDETGYVFRVAILDVLGSDGYDVSNAIRLFLANGWQYSELRLFSSYEVHSIEVRMARGQDSAPRPFPVHAKTPYELDRLHGDIVKALEKCKPGKAQRRAGRSTAVEHVLVTGAGFEISSDGSPGIKRTRDLLIDMGKSLRDSGLLGEVNVWKDADAVGNKEDIGRFVADYYPPFAFGDASNNGDIRRLFFEAAEASNLDEYWNLLLKSFQKFAPGGSSARRAHDKAVLLKREELLRQAFRQQFQHGDWGHIKHITLAAKLDWAAWLSTNYTRFADRAISLASREDRARLGPTAADGREERPDPGTPPEPWKIISIEAEVRSLAQTLWASNEDRSASLPGRILFKLHGDIEHLNTMAIAGEDKEIFNNHSFKPEEIYQNYSSAQTYLDRRRNLFSDRPRCWHVVGHGLQDRLLANLIHDLWKPGDFLILVNTSNKPWGNLQDRQSKFLANKGRAFAVQLKAADYFSELDWVFASHRLPDLQDLEKFLRSGWGAVALEADPPPHKRGRS